MQAVSLCLLHLQLSFEEEAMSDLMWRTDSREEAFSCRIFSVNEVERTAHDGRHGTFVEIESPDWIVAIPWLRREDGVPCFVMEEQYRHGSDSITREFPAGLVEKGEKAIVAAERELMEETGMKGARSLKPGLLQNKILLNLDSEEEGELYVGCAGGLDCSATFRYSEIPVPAGYTGAKIAVKGLLGGHSGMDIVLYRANANKVMARVLLPLLRDLKAELVEIEGGTLRNAIPREAFATIAVEKGKLDEAIKIVARIEKDARAEFSATDKDMKISIEEAPVAAKAIESKVALNMIKAIYGCPSSVERMSDAMPGLVETSTNLASVKFEDRNRIVVTSSQRSSVESAKTYVMQMVESVFALAGADVAHSDGYPGWTPNPASRLLQVTEEAYERLFATKPKVRAIHAGLECGLFLEKYPDLEMVSFGPTLRGVHSPDERLEIATVPKFWSLLCETLRNL